MKYLSLFGIGIAILTVVAVIAEAQDKPTIKANGELLKYGYTCEMGVLYKKSPVNSGYVYTAMYNKDGSLVSCELIKGNK